MSRIPRLLPLVGVAIGGVVAVNALAGARAIPDLFSATKAAAEEALHPKTGPKAGQGKAAQSTPPDAAAPAGQSAASPMPVSALSGPAPAPICAPSAADLAKAAGLSPAELQVLQSLQARRGQIEDRAKDLDVEVQLMNAAQTKLDAKLQSMNGLKADIQALLGQADQKTQGEVDRLVVVYSKMKPADAAAIMAQLDDKVRIPIAASMKPAVLSAILGKMGTMDAKVLTEKLAHRFAQVQSLADAANAPPGAAAADPKAKPAAQAVAKTAKPQAAAPDADATDDPADAAPTAPLAKAKAAHKPAPRRVARAAPKTPVPAKPKATAAEAKADGPALPAKPQPYDAASKDKAPAAAPAKTG